jgi:pimeloyl-ACP methyl ester carboxylesterase
MQTVLSKDGTAIAYERLGAGPPLILVDGALCSRAFGPMPKLAPLLARHFTVFMYDRRGRGGSGDTKPYSKDREVEDLEALIREAGRPAFVLGLSSGGALALEAAARGLDIARVCAYEPPFVAHNGANHAGHEANLNALIALNRRGDAVRYFMRKMVGVPAIFVVLMRLMPGMWRKLEAVAHTLPYDAAVMGDFSVPARRLASVRIPALAMNGEKTDARLRRAAKEVAEALPNASHRILKGQTHNVKAEILAPAVAEFFKA